MFANGVEEAMRINDGFATPEAAADFWAEGAAAAVTEDITFPGGAGQPQAARIYRGDGAGTLVFLHGGGWSGGSIALNERACRALAQSGWDVLSLSYRLAPAHPYPAALQDAGAGLRWLMQEGRAHGLRADRIALAGASAGGNLALSLALTQRQTTLAGLLLFYPVCCADFDTDSYRTYAEGFGLSRERMMDLFALYDPEGLRDTDPGVTPLTATPDQIRAAQLPVTQIISAELDVLADDSRALAHMLLTCDLPHDLHIEPGVTHGFINRGRLIPAADRCLDRAASYLTSLRDHANA